MPDLSGIYTELIAEESRNPENRHHLDHPTRTERGHNPSCGDEITLELQVAGGVIQDASFTGAGCAISQASTSLMINLIKGQPVEKARHLADLFLRMIKGEITDDSQLEELEDAMALKSIAHMPARVKCAVLSWHTLETALDQDKA
ncbi:MAG: SUF system NifU family Fe-S cluster assembly protein [Succiniclasticum sp.]|jgi:nitrogen fixation NifU-like protein|nr:SUF system NifU family Fe-S cluster assembly protein [Succiniclasticum sp.]MCI6222686.1 SUF system NifU family Fe-S cluster assembly protein [Selenomonadales bacterium]MDY2869396.1 SUF system NifU family Fe-S cluster assembly protein [Succiniclasticum sp.]MDY6346679.1 SUF system NifU family Fe-S cluster assembly protein [Succiniclasticum sp.]